MAVSDLSPALRASASLRPHPKTRPGYGKRSVPGQCPPPEADFTLLPERERHIAGYVDALPEGAAMDIKSLAKSQPLYGQMAVGSALRALGVAGHLRHVRCLSGEGDQVRWVTRTFWSRTAHDNEWWTAFLAAEEHHPAPQEATEAVALAPVEAPEPEPVHVPAQPPTLVVPQQRTAQPQPGLSPAFAALARLGRTDSRLALSAADCAALEQAAGEWFARGVDADYLTHALTAGLPASVDSPFGFVRRRLHDKLPPRLPATTPTPQTTPVRRLMMECTECGAPGRPEAFHDGLCRPCRELDPA
ncbi:MarR family transcriptional regulator [Streptomyces sp. NBC_00893]|uniref:MarR family transcriptional regulator n=1 Tax=Streptomyces sp. NBC_00893 TaxID=2975862 RepID=UPI0022548765|nr:MarR family transcriptional regulator [Streptomyces sp. NBC_00893]MCX4846203.1 MarR family transcriptional regulator [Streptomyces sp. NBC_00893]